MVLHHERQRCIYDNPISLSFIYPISLIFLAYYFKVYTKFSFSNDCTSRQKPPLDTYAQTFAFIVFFQYNETPNMLSIRREHLTALGRWRKRRTQRKAQFMKKILFVCHGNICRSPMAEFVMRELVHEAGLTAEIGVASRALHTDEIGRDTHRGTREVLKAHGIPFTRRSAALMTRADYDTYDYIIGMDRENMRDLHRLTDGDPGAKVHKLLSFVGEQRDVADPWYTGDFAATYRDVDAGCRALLRQLTERR